MARRDAGGYAAFISYSHAVDGQLAPALQRGLQRFAKRWHELRALNIFRDETSLSTNPHLWESIEAALAKSRYFVLMASPVAAQSPWVAREVAWWLANRAIDRILIVLTQGTLKWDHASGDFFWNEDTPLPPNLRDKFANSPRHLDLRWAQSALTDLSLQHNRFREAVADLAATLHGRPKEELIGEEVTQHRRVRRLARGAMAGLALLALAATGGAVWATVQARIAEEQRLAAEAARVEAITHLADFAYERALLAQSQQQPRLALALFYRLLTDPQLAAGVRDPARVQAQLPRSIGDYVLDKLSLEEAGRFPTHEAFGLAGGRLVTLRRLFSAHDSDWTFELLDVLDEEVLASVSTLSIGSIEEIGMARYLGGELWLLIGQDRQRELRRFDPATRSLALLRELPALPGDASGGIVFDASQLSEDNATLLIASASFNLPDPVLSHVLDLTSGQVVPVDNEGEVQLARPAMGGKLTLSMQKSRFGLLAARDGKALMAADSTLALIDLRTGRWSGVAPPIPMMVEAAGVAEDGRLWAHGDGKIVVWEPATSAVVAETDIEADYVTAVTGTAALVALHRCGTSISLVSLETLRAAASFEVASACDNNFAPTEPQRVGETTAVLAQGRYQPYALHLFGGGTHRTVELPFSVTMNLVFDRDARWVMVDPDSVPAIAPIAELPQLLAIAREELGADADKELDQLLQEFER